MIEPLIPLSIRVPPRGSRSILFAFHQQLRAAILDGRLKPGLRLPSTRALAAAYGVSRNTAIAAYDLLQSEGYLSTRRGSGTVVAEALPGPRPFRPHDRLRATRLLNRYWRDRTRPRSDIARQMHRSPTRFAFDLGAPDIARFPYHVWHRLSGRVARRIRAAGHFPKYDPQGLEGLRDAIAKHVSFARAVACGADDVIVTAGAHQAFDLLARVLSTPGRSMIAVEDPGYPPLRAAFMAHGARVAPVPVDVEGLVVERIPPRARVVYVTPSHQFPLGVVMSPHRRAELLDWCRRRGSIVIEDDYDGEFRFGERPLDALQTLDRAQSVFYVGTFSKCLLPDLRLGYIIAPPWARHALVAAKQAADGQCSVMAQSTLGLLIREGHLVRHVRKMQRLYDRRRRLLLAELNTSFKQWLQPLPAFAGLHIAARLERPGNETSVIARARAAGVGVGALRPYYCGRPAMQGLLFGFGNINEHAIAEGLQLLRRSMPAR